MKRITMSLLLTLASCGNLMDSRSCLRECSTRNEQCLTGFLFFNIPVTQNPALNSAIFLSCDTDSTSCEERCSQPLAE